MKYNFIERKLQVDGEVIAYAEKKVGKLDRYFKSEADASITFSVEKDRNVCEVTVRAGSMIFRASESTSDMFASIDSAVATLERQIRKNKTRNQTDNRGFSRTVFAHETINITAANGHVCFIYRKLFLVFFY